MVGYKSILSSIDRGTWGVGHSVKADDWTDPSDKWFAKVAASVGTNLAAVILNTQSEVDSIGRDPGLTSLGRAERLKGKGGAVVQGIEQSVPHLRRMLGAARTIRMERERIGTAFEHDSAASAPRAAQIREELLALAPLKRATVLMKARDSGAVALLHAWTAWPLDMLTDANDVKAWNESRDTLIDWAHPHLTRRLANADAFVGTTRYYMRQAAEYLTEHLQIREGVPSRYSLDALDHDPGMGWPYDDSERHVDLDGYVRAAYSRAGLVRIAQAPTPPLTSFAPDPRGPELQRMRDARLTALEVAQQMEGGDDAARQTEIERQRAALKADIGAEGMQRRLAQMGEPVAEPVA